MEAIFAGISAFVECVIGIVKLFFCGFVNLGRSALDANLDKAQRRRTALVACLQIGASLAAVAGAIGLFSFLDYQAGKKSRMRLATDRVVNTWADKLDSQLDADGRYVREAKQLADVDAWGRPLVLTYIDEPWGETLVVRSSGLDQQLDTPDDITAERSNLIGQDVAKNAAKHVTKSVTQKLHKLMRREVDED